VSTRRLTIRAVSLDYAQAVLIQQNITAIQRVQKSDNNRIAQAVGATIVNRVEDLREADVGTSCLSRQEVRGQVRAPACRDLNVIHITTGTFCCIPSTVRELEESYKQCSDLRAWLMGWNWRTYLQTRTAKSRMRWRNYGRSIGVKIPLYGEHC
jgi:hypothetical protein